MAVYLMRKLFDPGLNVAERLTGHLSIKNNAYLLQGRVQEFWKGGSKRGRKEGMRAQSAREIFDHAH